MHLNLKNELQFTVNEMAQNQNIPVKGQESMTPFEFSKQQICSFLFPTMKPNNRNVKTINLIFVSKTSDI